MNIGIIGCGFTADHYLFCLQWHPELKVVGATDRDPERASKFCNLHKVKLYPTLEDMLSDGSIDMVLNLTNSSSHYETSKACLNAGKHLFTEKPLATDFSQAKELVELADAKGVYFSAAPCNLLGETAQTLWKALRNKEIGDVRLVLAELDDGPFHLAAPHTWQSESGAPYDYREEFKMGVTVEHSAYYLGLFAAFFGPARTVTPFSAVLWPERRISSDETLQLTTPDFSVACITFESGVVARLTCSLVAPFNHVLKITGDTGVITVNEVWNYTAKVYVDKYTSMRYRAERYSITKEHPVIANMVGNHKVYPPVRKANLKKRYARYHMDYGRGIADLALAIQQQRPPRIPADFCLHLTELGLAIQKAEPGPYQVKTTFKPLQPLDEAGLNELIPAKW
ncbi:MAG TPA: Gfo/Idh/MocA family oxidoreductase [Acidobacteriaceae bacterium]|nr:Gfo/Idh/MocA family oxidoreductase [Acidobacteriaceae bacterium]